MSDALDRTALVRKDPTELNRRLASDSTRIVPIWRNRCLVVDGSPPRPGLVARGAAEALLSAASEKVWLGQLGSAGVFAVDVSEVADPEQELGLAAYGQFSDLRAVGSLLEGDDFGLLAFARAMMYWHRHNAFCADCGQPTRARQGGHVRECASGHKRFPRTDPAVMVLITLRDRCVLARQPSFPKGFYSVLAGFVEPGETLEQCVVRESLEEVGLRITRLRYLRSQPWPFPASLMLGFVAEAEDEVLRLDDDELEDARWFSRSELENPQGFSFPPSVSLAYHLITGFRDGRIASPGETQD